MGNIKTEPDQQIVAKRLLANFYLLIAEPTERRA